jgi:hypothetical protein
MFGVTFFCCSICLFGYSIEVHAALAIALYVDKHALL